MVGQSLFYSDSYYVMKNVFLAACAFFLLMACHNSTDCRISHPIIDVEEIVSIDVPLQGAQYNHVTPAIYEIDTAVFFLGLDPYSYGIDVFNLCNRQYLFHIQLHRDGPDEILSPRAMYVHNLDSIFLLNDINQLYLVNRKGEKMKFWDFDFSLPDSIMQLDKSLTGEFIIAAYGKNEYLNLPFFYNEEDHTLIARILLLNDKEGSDEYDILYRTPNMAQIDLSTGGLKKLFGLYPKEYLKESRPHNPFAHFVVFDNNTWIQFDASDKIYWCEKDTFLCAPSHYSRGNISTFSSSQDIDEQLEIRSYHTDEAYVGIYYDPYADVIYRIFQHAQPDKNNEGKFNQKLQAAFSVMIMKPTGEVIGEAKFEKEKYNFLDVFVTRKGLLISKENPFNKDNYEEFYSFDLIKFRI